VATVRKAKAEDFEKAYEVLQGFTSRVAGKQELKRLFESHWETGEDHYGYLLEDKGRAVGFLGTIYSVRNIRGKRVKFCNFTNGIVMEQYRGQSLSLFMSVLKRNDLTITDFSPSVEVFAILKKFRFAELGRKTYVIPPLPRLTEIFSRCRLYYRHEDLEKRLEGEALRIFQDHRKFKSLKHILVKTDVGDCYVTFIRHMLKKLPFAYVFHLDGPDIFLRHLTRISINVLPRAGAVAIAVPERYLRGRRPSLSIAKKHKGKTTIFRSPDLLSEDIDQMYSEQVLLRSELETPGQ
jgi:hypothetical protein